MTWVAWGKLQRNADGQVCESLDLVSHCIDVAAVVHALLELPTIRERMEHLAGRALAPSDILRLTVLAFLHDIGKASRGFQSKWFDDLQQRLRWLDGVDLGACGHIFPVAALLHIDSLTERFATVFPLQPIYNWHGTEQLELWLAAISHHGNPISCDSLKKDRGPVRHVRCWHATDTYNPWDTLELLGETAQQIWPDAFVGDARALPISPAFTHAFAGLVSLADWVGSDTHEQAFPYALASTGERWEASFARARQVLKDKRINMVALQAQLRENPRGFGNVFRDPITGKAYSASPLQAAMDDRALGPLVVVEAETGSGKTEAALWRFKALFEQGKVDSLAFVLPTRVSAVQICQRIERFMASLFPDVQTRPNVVLAVPGYLRVDGVDAIERLPGFEVLWPDQEVEQLAHLRWAAENCKRYLAAACAVGTVDQVLLSGLTVRHAHLRGFSLLRSLLVVDEVHASDRYMVRILQQVVQRQVEAGGHALLLSATLGIASRDELIALGQSTIPQQAAVRERACYPAITDASGSRAIPGTGRTKRVNVDLRAWMSEPEQIADCACQAVASGARVLIVRNMVKSVIEVQQAVEAALGPDHPALFRCRQVVCPHHGRFAAPDRQLMDDAVTESFGKTSPTGARILCGSQTLEQSLDIDCDFLITDLAPMDILLQRFGRLHRHGERTRPPAYRQPRAIVLTPDNRDLGPALASRRSQHGIGGQVYENVLSIEATWRELAQRSVLQIPDHNRELIERCTDPETLRDLATELGEQWRGHWAQIEGKEQARATEAEVQSLNWHEDWNEVRFPAVGEQRIRTRLGADSLRVRFSETVISPFGMELQEMTVPEWIAGQLNANDAQVTVPNADPAGFSFSLGTRKLNYSRHGFYQTQELFFPGG